MVTEQQRRIAEAIVNVFETGSPKGDYGNVTVAAGDPGHLTYGRSQTTLASGNLHDLIFQYCNAPGARFGSELTAFLPRLRSIDLSLDDDATLKDLLRRAGDDPVMREVQDQFFRHTYWEPAAREADRAGIASGLGVTVVYDSTLHGSWRLIRDRTTENHGTLSAIGERTWVRRYMEERRNWLATHRIQLLRRTVFRMDVLLALADQDRWELELPIPVRSFLLDESMVGPPQSIVRGAAASSGFMIQGSFGSIGDFELVTPAREGGIQHFARENDDAALAWRARAVIGEREGAFTAPSLIQSTFSMGPNKGNLEVVARVFNRLVAFWRVDVEPFRWNGPFVLPAEIFENVGGNPALIQGSAGPRGNFELVVPRTDGGFGHYWRDNSSAEFTWSKSVEVGKADGRIEAIALLEGNFPSPGSLAVIARRQDGSLAEYRREPAPHFNWRGPFEVPLAGFGQGVTATGVPGFVQSRRGQPGNYELVTPLSIGGMAHLFRINQDERTLQWSAPFPFGADAGQVDAVALIQSNFGTPGLGNLDVAARSGDRVLLYWLPDQPPFQWSSPGLLLEPQAAARPTPGRVVALRRIVRLVASIGNPFNASTSVTESSNQGHPRPFLGDASCDLDMPGPSRGAPVHFRVTCTEGVRLRGRVDTIALACRSRKLEDGGRWVKLAIEREVNGQFVSTGRQVGYAHLDPINVTLGQIVEDGAEIGRLGPASPAGFPANTDLVPGCSHPAGDPLLDEYHAECAQHSHTHMEGFGGFSVVDKISGLLPGQQIFSFEMAG